MMEELAAVLKPLKLITKLLSGDLYPLLSFIYPTLKGLINKHLQTESGDTFMIKTFKNYKEKHEQNVGDKTQ